jgi:hypothetical protein
MEVRLESMFHINRQQVDSHELYCMEEKKSFDDVKMTSI